MANRFLISQLKRFNVTNYSRLPKAQVVDLLDQFTSKLVYASDVSATVTTYVEEYEDDLEPIELEFTFRLDYGAKSTARITLDALTWRLLDTVVSSTTLYLNAVLPNFSQLPVSVTGNHIYINRGDVVFAVSITGRSRLFDHYGITN